MPYIKKNDKLFDDQLRGLGSNCMSAGQLNYSVTTLVDGWLRTVGTTYTTLNAAIGVLECAKLELYRRVAAPYEDKKLKENGEVYESISSS